MDIADSSLLHRRLSGRLPEVVAGEGVMVVDSEGRRYLDACGGAAVSCLGHGDPRIGQAIAEQLGRIGYAHTSFFTNAPAEALAERLVAAAPAGFGRGRAMFLGSGSEAMEAALKLARQHALERGEARRDRIVARRMGYHGNTLGALSVSGHPQRRGPYAPFLFDVLRIADCHPYRDQRADEDAPAYGARLAAEFEEAVQRAGPDRVLALVVETVAGATLGCVPPVPGYLAGLRAVCDRYDILMIADEVMCGSGRCGTFYAIEAEGVAPDIISVAKGLGAGYQPIAATLASERVVATLAAGSGALANGHTYMSHAVACAGALAVLAAIDEDRLLDRVDCQGRRLRAGLEARLRGHPLVGDIRGRGLFHAVEFVADKDRRTPLPPGARFASRLKDAAMPEGLLIYPAQGGVDGTAGDHVVIAPPYTVADEETDLIVNRLARAVDAAARSAGLAA